MQKRTRIALMAAAALAFPAAASAQTQTPAPTQPAPAAQAPAPQNEAAQIQQRIASLQQQALQDSTVAAAAKQFETDLMATLTRLDPTAAEKRARADALKAEVEAARAASDNAKLTQLAAEAQQLQSFFAGLNARANQDPELQQKRQAYLAVVFKRMTEIDPQAPQLVERLQALRNGGQ